jgi:hypothetical protein
MPDSSARAPVDTPSELAGQKAAPIKVPEAIPYRYVPPIVGKPIKYNKDGTPRKQRETKPKVTAEPVVPSIEREPMPFYEGLENIRGMILAQKGRDAMARA